MLSPHFTAAVADQHDAYKWALWCSYGQHYTRTFPQRDAWPRDAVADTVVKDLNLVKQALRKWLP